MNRFLVLTVLLCLAGSPGARADGGGQCRVAFEQVGSGQQLADAVQATSVEQYKEEIFQRLSGMISDADRDRIYAALVRDEAGLFGNSLAVIEDAFGGRTIHEKSRALEFRMKHMKAEAKHLQDVVRTSNGKDRVRAEKNLLEHEIWASRQLLKILMGSARHDKTAQLTYRSGLKNDYKLARTFGKNESQYQILFEWMQQDPAKLAFGELLMLDVYHQLTTSLADYTLKEIRQARLQRGTPLPSRLNPLNLMSHRQQIESALVSIEQNLEEDFKVDADRHTFTEVPTTRNLPTVVSVPTVQSTVPGIYSEERSRVYSVLYGT
ncbi:MAG: hypothetical protein EOP06_08190, partial [Proteobacteria bacterium]